MDFALLVAGVVFLGLAVHPFCTYPLSLAIFRRLRPKPISPSEPARAGLTYSVCVCAYNEEAVIRDKITDLLALRRQRLDLEILVYVDGGDDRTAEIARAFEDEIILVIAPERTGKTVGMNRLVELSSGDVVIFTDANVALDESVPVRLKAYFADPSVGCVCGHLAYVNEHDSVTAENGSIYWRLEEAIKQLESDTGSAIGADGSLYAIRRELYRPVPEDLIDDFYVSMTILTNGHRVVRGADVRAFEHSSQDARDEFLRKVRIACQAFNVHRRIARSIGRLGWLDLYKYVSHKLLRWLAIYNLALAGVLFLLSLGLAAGWHVAAAALALGAIAIAAGSVLRVPLLSSLANMLIMLTGVGVGIAYSLRGEQFRLWTPVASVRVLSASVPEQLGGRRATLDRG